ncbi:serine/threonine protein kinase, partial [Paenibacillus sp. OT2-17]|uniref:serine/threonine protein kinase n=1 Tax=Paenibacillus sp. OT2-17 TaxID=2691605 RepID=UPI001352E938
MFQQGIFKIDEDHAGIEVSKTYKEYRFPVEMLASGRGYNGVEASLNKPHGKKVIMDFVIKTLSKGTKQYKPFINQILQKYSWIDLNDALEILLLDGIIQITFKNLKPRKMTDWIPKSIQIDPRAMEYLIRDEPNYDVEFKNLRESVIKLVFYTKSPIKNLLLKWINEKIIKDQTGSIITDSTSFNKYKSIILMVAHYIIFKENDEKVPLRYLSNQIWSQPRLLSKYKNEVVLSAGITLDELDSVLLPDINNTLHAPFILISPVHKLIELVTRLSKLLDSDVQQDTILLHTNEMEYYVKSIVEIVSESREVLDEFLLMYNAFKKEIFQKKPKESHLSMLNDLELSIITLKNKLLKIDYVRRKFELIVLDEIGNGSFAIVYKVFDPELKKIVACKVLFPRSHFKRVYRNDGDEYLIRF